VSKRVLVGVMMPRLNGYPTCRALKQDPALDAFLTQPADIPLLLQTIAEVTDRA
jgi:CheY-like chemotaxis protein